MSRTRNTMSKTKINRYFEWNPKPQPTPPSHSERITIGVAKFDEIEGDSSSPMRTAAMADAMFWFNLLSHIGVADISSNEKRSITTWQWQCRIVCRHCRRQWTSLHCLCIMCTSALCLLSNVPYQQSIRTRIYYRNEIRATESRNRRTNLSICTQRMCGCVWHSSAETKVLKVC